MHTVFALLCFVVVIHWTDFPISIRLTLLALWQSNDCPSASKATLMNMDKYFMWIHYERLHNHNKAKHNKTVCIFLGIYCMSPYVVTWPQWIMFLVVMPLMTAYKMPLCLVEHKRLTKFENTPGSCWHRNDGKLASILQLISNAISWNQILTFI